MAISNLYAKYRHLRGLSDLPVVVLMAGWGGNANSLTRADLIRIAGYGLFVLAVGMRGRNSADGARDASAREIYDIYDALAYVRANFAGIVSADKAAIVGYSGGGGNALAAACKFPDTWNCVVSHFGMSDYGVDATDGWHANNGGSYTAEIETAVGDTPTNTPDAYAARDAVSAIPNYSGGGLYLYHDASDATVPKVHSTRIGAAMLAAGRSNYSENYSQSGDAVRWSHGYPADNSALITAEATWAAAIIANAAWTIPASGTVTVIGYIVTKRFTVWLGDGTSEAATVAYGAVSDEYLVTPLTGSVAVTITQGAKTVTQTISEATTLTVTA